MTENLFLFLLGLSVLCLVLAGAAALANFLGKHWPDSDAQSWWR